MVKYLTHPDIWFIFTLSHLIQEVVQNSKYLDCVNLILSTVLIGAYQTHFNANVPTNNIPQVAFIKQPIAL